MKDLGLKLIALLLACVLWFIVSGPRREIVRERRVTASVSMVAVPSHLVITTELPSGVAVRVRGRMSDLKALASQTIEASVDLSSIAAGEVEVTLRPQYINVPEGIEV
ncbi:MAG TPA: CdaR family protein, partial [Thermoanaerobaculia bacterium]|nr:CdaR family protein [Thermoanaerobaculia bacterium]